MNILRQCVSDIFEDKYLIAKIQNLSKTKGIESDLRFLLEKSYFIHSVGIIPETEVGNRTDLKLTIDDKVFWIEIKCYDGVLNTEDTKSKISNDIVSLSKKNNDDIRIFIYFGLYGNHQPPKKSFIPEERINEIKDEITAIKQIIKNNNMDLQHYEYLDLSLEDRIIYSVIFYLKEVEPNNAG